MPRACSACSASACRAVIGSRFRPTARTRRRPSPRFATRSRAASARRRPAGRDRIRRGHERAAKRSDRGLTDDARTGLSGAPGVAVGPVWRFHAGAGGRPPDRVADEAAARAVLEPAARAAPTSSRPWAAGLRARDAADEAEILEAQALMAGDPALLDAAVHLAAAGSPPLDALREAAAGFAASLARLDDPLLAARAVDVLDVADRIGRVLLGVAVEGPDRPSIAVADDLPPSVTAEIPAGSLLGIALEGEHAARARRDPGTRPRDPGRRGRARTGRCGRSGRGRSAACRRRPRGDRRRPDGRRARRADRACRDGHGASSQRRRAAASAAATADGRRVRLLANIGSPRDLPRALAVEPEGVGLLRTEFLFMERSREPTEAEQVAAYREILEAFGAERPVVIRLADVGGDKQIPYLDLPAEANPFLGVRAIRLGYRSPDLLVRQLRAISRAAAATPRHGADGRHARRRGPLQITLRDSAGRTGRRWAGPRRVRPRDHGRDPVGRPHGPRAGQPGRVLQHRHE